MRLSSSKPRGKEDPGEGVWGMGLDWKRGRSQPEPDKEDLDTVSWPPFTLGGLDSHFQS